MSNTIRTNDGRYYQKPGVMATGAGIVAGSLAGSAVTLAQQPFATRCMSKMQDIAKTADTVEIRNGLNKALELGGVADKVKIKDFANAAESKSFFDIFGMRAEVRKTNPVVKKIDLKQRSFGMKEYNDMFAKIDPHNVKVKKMNFVGRLKNKLDSYIKNQLDVIGAIKKGKNAGFNNVTNEVLINTEKLGVSGFHEIGHSINYNNSKFWKTMQKLRMPAMAIPSLLLTIALFKRKKAEGEEPKGFIDRTTTFIKNNVGKLSTLAMAPIVAEELMATKRGNALAKQILSPENYKKVVKANKFGAATYIAAALFVGGGAYVANKVKDAIAKPKEIRFREAV